MHDHALHKIYVSRRSGGQRWARLGWQCFGRLTGRTGLDHYRGLWVSLLRVDWQREQTHDSANGNQMKKLHRAQTVVHGDPHIITKAAQTRDRR